MRYSFSLLLLLCALSVSNADEAQVFGESYYGGAIEPSHLSLSIVENAFERGDRFRSVEQFLRWARREDPRHLSHFSLMRKSRSLQRASDSHPRAIVYGSDAKFIFAFNGDPLHEGYDRIEMIQFVEPDPKTVRGAHLVFRELAFHSDRVELSEQNPPKCMQCHTTSLHHLWDQYENWEGAYGERDDAILNKNDRYVFGGNPQSIIDLYNQEFDAYQTFLKHRSVHPRYRELNFPEGSPVSPYSPSHRGERKFRPNLHLTKNLTEIQAKLLMAKLLKQEDCFEHRGFMLLAHLMGCQNDPRFSAEMKFDESRVLSILAQKYPENRETVKWSSYTGYESWESAGSYLRLMGFELQDWSLKFLPEHWSYFEGERYQQQLLAERIYFALREREPNLPSAWPLDISCRALLDKHLAQGESRGQCLVTPPFAELKARPPAVVMCASCHENHPGAGPQFKFEDPHMKSAILERIAFDSGKKQMPPQRHLSEREREEIRSYLQH